MCRPKDRVQHDLAKHVVPPAHVVVPARETKSTALAIRSLVGPTNMLALAIRHRTAHIRIPTPCTIPSLQRFRWR